MQEKLFQTFCEKSFIFSNMLTSQIIEKLFFLWQTLFSQNMSIFHVTKEKFLFASEVLAAHHCL